MGGFEICFGDRIQSLLMDSLHTYEVSKGKGIYNDSLTSA